ncbi:MAG: glutathione-disulfide reductase [Nannocystaceae bacterium]
MQRHDYDLFTIGAGSGGVRASRLAASMGARVAIAEERRLRGTCVNVGCVPKKLLVYASHYRDDFADAVGFGWSRVEPDFDWATLIAHKDAEISRLNGVYGRILAGAGVEVLDQRAQVVGPHTISVGGREVTAERILVATGSWPDAPSIPGAELAFTSNEAFALPRLPRRVAIIGGGYIAVEFAGIFHGLGVEVSLLYRGDLFLRGFDSQLRRHLAAELRRRGVDLRFHADPAAIEADGEGRRVVLKDGAVIETDAVMLATGRRPNLHGLGLEALGVELDDQGAIVVDDHFRSSVPSVFAIGDVIGRAGLTPVAIVEGAAFAATHFGGRPTKVDYSQIPTAIFSQPPMAAVGLSEDDAHRRYGPVDVYSAEFRPLRHTLSGREERTLMKLIVDPATDRVLGAHMIGADAAEIIQSLAVALRCGATKEQFDATIALHPTVAEEFVTMRTRRVSAPE